MRKDITEAGGYFHLFNRSFAKETIFNGDRDYSRFLFLCIFLQSREYRPVQTKRQIDFYKKNGFFNIDSKTIQEITYSRSVELVAFAFMPNHFHLLVREIQEGGISLYMQRVQAGYAKYLQVKSGREGHLFRGPYKAVGIESNNQLLYLSTYIHKNPKEISAWRGKEDKYPWSSYQDYISNNRWGELLETKIILEQFSSVNEYKEFTRTSIAKESDFSM